MYAFRAIGIGFLRLGGTLRNTVLNPYKCLGSGCEKQVRYMGEDNAVFL